MNISKDNISGIKNIPGVNVTSCIVPCTEIDNYPTHDSTYGAGGWREVRTIQERDAIPFERRKLGMAVYVTTNNTIYILKHALNNTCWHEFNPQDVASIINDAIAAGKVEVDLTSCVTNEQLENILKDFSKSAQTEQDIAEAIELIKNWVLAKNYLTEHQSLEGLATEEFVANAIVEEAKAPEGEDFGILEPFETTGAKLVEVAKGFAQIAEDWTDVITAKEDIAAIKEALGTPEEIEGTIISADKTVNANLSALDYELGEVIKAIGGGEEPIQVVTKEEFDALAEKQQADYELLRDNLSEVVLEYATKEQVGEMLTEYAKASEVDEKLESYVKGSEMVEYLSAQGYVNTTYLRGFATESFVKDYVARVMEGKVKPGA